MAQKMAVIGLQHKMARLAGDIELLKERNRRYQTEIDALVGRIAANQATISDLEAGISALQQAAQTAFSVNLPPPVPRKTIPKRHYHSWGSVTRALLAVLSASKHTPLSTWELANAVSRALDLNLSDRDTKQLQVTIRHRLKALCRKDLVQPAVRSTFPGEPTTWLIKDTAA